MNSVTCCWSSSNNAMKSNFPMLLNRLNNCSFSMPPRKKSWHKNYNESTRRWQCLARGASSFFILSVNMFRLFDCWLSLPSSSLSTSAIHHPFECRACADIWSIYCILDVYICKEKRETSARRRRRRGKRYTDGYVLSLSLSFHHRDDCVRLMIIVIFLSTIAILLCFTRSFDIHSRWGQSLLCIIRQQHKQLPSADHPTLEENTEIVDLQLSPDQAAHARACAK